MARTKQTPKSVGHHKAAKQLQKNLLTKDSEPAKRKKSSLTSYKQKCREENRKLEIKASGIRKAHLNVHNNNARRQIIARSLDDDLNTLPTSYTDGVRLKTDAIAALHDVAEDTVQQIFQSAWMLTCSADRITMSVSDLSHAFRNWSQHVNPCVWDDANKLIESSEKGERLVRESKWLTSTMNDPLTKKEKLRQHRKLQKEHEQAQATMNILKNTTAEAKMKPVVS